MQIPARPYPFPLRKTVSPHNTAFLFIDFQGDFCAPGGFMQAQGLDLDALRAPLPAAIRLLAAARQGGFTVIHTRESYAADLSDAPPNRLWKGRKGTGAAVGDMGPMGRYLITGEPGWQIVPELTPHPGEQVFNKPSYGAFATTGLADFLTKGGLSNLIVAGVTSDCCVHQTVQEALDRGFDCLTVKDASGAGFASVHERMMQQIVLKNGVFGTIADSATVIDALSA